MSEGNLHSILIYILIILVMLGFNKITKNNKLTIILLIITLCCLSYMYKPLTAVDLTRQQDTLAIYSHYSFSDLITVLFKTTDFSRLLYFWLIAQVNDPNLLQFFAALIFYTCNFYIIYDVSKKKCDKNEKAFGITVTLFLLCGQFIFVISGIRTAIAFAIINLCYYNETFNNKSFVSNIPFYVIAVGFHSSTLPIFFIRLLILMFENKRNKFFDIITILVLVIIIVFAGYDVVNYALSKASEYIIRGTFYNRPEYLQMMLEFLLFSLIIILSFKLEDIEDYSIIKKYRKLVLVVYLLSLCLSFQYTIFTRYVRLVEMMITPILLYEYKYIFLKRREKGVINLYHLVINALLLMIIVVCFFEANMSVFNIFDIHK